MRETCHRASVIAHVTGDPFFDDGRLELVTDGALILDQTGKVKALEKYARLSTADLEKYQVVDHGEAWILPGFVDGHIHFPQVYATAALSGDLLTWLEEVVFPAEAAFADPAFARKAADRFVRQLRGHGTTCALVFGSQFPLANLALFEAARNCGIRLVSGPTLMDQGGPEALLTSPSKAYEDASALISAIQGEDRMGFAITPRFALSCSHELMEVCQTLVKENPGSTVQTHINENVREIQAVRDRFPQMACYAEVYDRYQLLGPNTVLAHNVHPTPADLALIGKRGSWVCHCPASNAYLGSGLFSLKKHLAHGIPVLVGTDLAASPYCSVIQELTEVHRASQLIGGQIDASGLLYLGTLAGAKALGLEDKIGNFAHGKEADFIVVHPGSDDYFAERLASAPCAEMQLFPLLAFAKPQHITKTYVAGEQLQPE